jgi:hypothetical protein
MIELTYIDDHEELGQVVEGTPIIMRFHPLVVGYQMHFKTWKELDKFVRKEKLNKYKIQGKEKGGHIKIQYKNIKRYYR